VLAMVELDVHGDVAGVIACGRGYERLGCAYPGEEIA
jgi:hypothetical protein